MDFDRNLCQNASHHQLATVPCPAHNITIEMDFSKLRSFLATLLKTPHCGRYTSKKLIEMKCEKCAAEIAEGSKYCPVCNDGKAEFEFICPYCGYKMSLGMAKIKSNWFGVLMAGYSHQHLYFEDADGNEDLIVRTHSQKEAYLCKNCEGVFIPA